MTDDEVRAAAEYVAPIRYGTCKDARWGGMSIVGGGDVWDAAAALHRHHRTLAGAYLARLAADEAAAAERNNPDVQNVDWLKSLGFHWRLGVGDLADGLIVLVDESCCGCDQWIKAALSNGIFSIQRRADSDDDDEDLLSSVDCKIKTRGDLLDLIRVLKGGA